MSTEVPEVVTRMADDVLFPAAMATDAADVVPLHILDRLAEAGLYGMAGPPDAGGMGVDLDTAARVVEVLAGGCLTTTFVWLQHQSAVIAAAYLAPVTLRDEWLGPLCRGDTRAGVALAGVLPGPACLTARETPDGWLLDGTSPWVTGWGRVDVLQVAARDADDNLVWLLADVAPGPSLRADPLHMVAVNASATVALHFDQHLVPSDRLIRVQPYAEFAGDVSGSRINASLTLGVTRRCCALLGPSPLDDELDACRRALDESSPDDAASARAASRELASRAAATLVVAEGSGAVLVDRHPQRLAREALFLLVFGSRPIVKTALLDLLKAPRSFPG